MCHDRIFEYIQEWVLDRSGHENDLDPGWLGVQEGSQVSTHVVSVCRQKKNVCSMVPGYEPPGCNTQQLTVEGDPRTHQPMLTYSLSSSITGLLLTGVLLHSTLEAPSI